eukprot:3305256-Karenia_brevis.AAC.1
MSPARWPLRHSAAARAKSGRCKFLRPRDCLRSSSGEGKHCVGALPACSERDGEKRRETERAPPDLHQEPADLQSAALAAELRTQLLW